jgi:hypothetical protein
MPYIINKTNGAQIALVDNAELDNSTDITFVGRNYSGYGEVFNENFLRLLENFANTTQPAKPITGETWFNSSDNIKKLNVYDGIKFKSIANLQISSNPPTFSTTGDLWWDSVNLKLKLWNGNSYSEIGPRVSERADFKTIEEIVDPLDPTITQPVIEAVFGGNEKIVLSDVAFVPDSSSLLYSNFPIIKKGITLYGADFATGSSKSTGYYFWGTAAEALVANTATTSIISSTSTNQNFYLPFVNTTTGNVSYYAHTGISYNPSTGILNTIASQSLFADVAERYATDVSYDIGTVVVIGGDKEITVTHTHADTAVIGIISAHPAYRMNTAAGPDETHPYVALRGRVPCKVIGAVKKGALLVTSSYPGYAEVMKPNDNPNAVLGKSLQNFDGPKGIIEILV